jgi:hypothetical protein
MVSVYVVNVQLTRVLRNKSTTGTIVATGVDQSGIQSVASKGPKAASL